ncbi:MAG: MBL fold metallo-hydrolase [Candidatus Aenigmarchaeota archaeon]|nr:MBL fold metallo-hydrolase [Candidatus Aenigmarchaeota archaeon]
MLKRLGDVILLQLSENDSNIYIVGDVVIDSGTGFNFTRMYQILRIIKKDPKAITHVINTHGHFNHVGGNGYFLNAKVAIHELEAAILEGGDEKKSMADFFDGRLKPRKVDMKLRDGDMIGGLRVVHTPGHSPGSICLYNPKDKGIFTGDTLFSDGVGDSEIDGGDPDALAASLEKLSRLDVQKIFPGHGEAVMSNGSKAIKDIMKGE